MRKTLVFLFVALLLLVGGATKENEKKRVWKPFLLLLWQRVNLDTTAP